jgi:subtilisin-like proprotein convertase family protein
MHRFSKMAVIFMSAVVTAMAGVAPANGAVFFFSNSAGITIPQSGAGTPFPSNINVSGVTGVVTHIRAQIIGLTHTFPNDLDIILRSPGGQGVMLMSDAGGSVDVNNINLTFDDCALRIPPDGSVQIVSGRYRPSNYDADTILAGAPDDPATTLGVFNGLSGVSVNGTWGLFVSDEAAPDQGSIAIWTLTIYTDTSLPANLNPVPCGKPDFDGDGRADQVVYQPTTGNWFVVGSAQGFFTAALNFGGAGFTPVAGDYDGDGVTDAAVYQTSTGNWFVIGSTQGFFVAAVNFGGAGFTPVPADYDGDGETDPAVYQTSTGHWFVVGSSKGFFAPALGFGGAGFNPVPAAQ